MNQIKLHELDTPLSPGQFWRHTSNEIYLIVAEKTCYGLISLHSGERYYEFAEEIENVFGGDRDCFVLVKSPFTVTPKYD